MARVLWIAVMVLLAIWALGAVLKFAGALIHLLLVIAVIIAVYNLFLRSRD